MPTTDRVLRPAGLLETYHIVRQELGLDSCVVVGARFVRGNTNNVSDSNEQARLTREEVYGAVVHVLSTHAALSVRVVRGTYVYESLENVNLDKVVRFLDDGNDDVAALIEHEFTQPIPVDAGADVPLWRLTVAPRNTLVFAWHHCIGDGQSGLAVLRTLLAGLNAHVPAPSDMTISTTPTPTLPLTPRIEELTDLRVSFWTLLSLILQGIVPTRWTAAARTWTGNPVPSVPSTQDAVVSHTRIRLISLPPTQTARLLAAARAHHTTLTSVLSLLGIHVLAELVSLESSHHVNKKEKKKYDRLSISIPVSLRPLAGLPQTTMAESVSSYQFSPPLSLSPSNSNSCQNSNEAFDWPRAAAFSQTLHASIPKTRELIGTAKYLRSPQGYSKFFRSKLGVKRGISLEISNPGLFKVDVDPSPTPDAQVWSITETYFSQDDNVVGAALKMSVVGSPCGSVNICIAWGVDAVEDDFAEKFVSDLEGALAELVDSEECGGNKQEETN